MYETIPLNHLNAGQTAQVEVVLGGVEQVHRLNELGLRQGAQVEMLQPGSPCILRLDGNKLCFRADEMLSVLVRLGVAT